MRERVGIFLILLMLCLVLCAQSVSEAGVVYSDRLMVTDVTPVKFSVVWPTSAAATCDLNIFLDAEGTTPYDEAVIFSESSEHFPAENIGVMKVRVVSLKPDSQYFFQTKTTFKRNGAVSLYPEGPPFIGVRTEASTIMVGNAVLVQKINTPAGRSEKGTLLIAVVDKASYPISGWTGEGVPDSWAAVDTNNFYNKETHINLMLEAGEAINSTVLGGGLCLVETENIVPQENGGIQPLEVAATLPESTCKNLQLKFMPWLPLLLLDD